LAEHFGLNTHMLNDDQFEDAVRDLIIDICEVMHRRGYEAVSVGAMMRLVGVSEERAQHHDAEFFALDAEFRAIIDARKNPPPKKTPAGVTLH
jgi:hypothetical protein